MGVTQIVALRQHTLVQNRVSEIIHDPVTLPVRVG